MGTVAGAEAGLANGLGKGCGRAGISGKAGGAWGEGGWAAGVHDALINKVTAIEPMAIWRTPMRFNLWFMADFDVAEISKLSLALSTGQSRGGES